MRKSLFAIAWGRAGCSDSGYKSHIFGGVVGGVSSQRAFFSACDYGGKHKFDPSGVESGEVETNSAVFIPVSDESVWSFGKWVRRFHDLREQGEFPFYFSLDGKVNPDGERRGVQPIDINGEAHGMPGSEDYTEFRDLKFTRYLVFSEDLQYARANCFTMLALMARLSGIDLARLHPDFDEVRHPPLMRNFCTEIFNERACKNAVYVSLPERKLKPFYEFVRMASQDYNGILGLKEAIQTWEVFQRTPQEVPEYIQTHI